MYHFRHMPKPRRKRPRTRHRSPRIPSRPHILVALWWWDPRLLQGIARYAHEKNWFLDTRVRFLHRLPIRRHYDGAIIFPGRDQRILKNAGKIGAPLITLDQHDNLLSSSRVFCDDFQIGRTAADHFHDRGLEQVGFVEFQGPASRAEQARGQGLREQCRKLGLRFHLLPFYGLQKALRRIPAPLGLLAPSDELAVEVLADCLEAGLRVPEQVSVLGVDDFETLCLHTPVPLSSINLNLEYWGYEAARELDLRLRRPKAPASTVVIPNLGVSERASTDIVHVPNEHLAAALHYLRNNFIQPITIAQLVQAVGVSRQSLQNYFHRYLGRTMHQELMRLRVEHARQLLQRTALNLEEIASASGFRDRQHLHRVFRSSTETTPGRYRRRCAKS